MPERYLGSTLGKYRIDALIGTGGFAWVYKAFDPELEIPVALKVLKPQFGGDADFVTRFKREASVAAKLRHPNIVKIYTIGREGDAVYFAMDYLPTGLADKLEVMDHLTEEAVIQIGMDVSRALGFAHREGVIHRDIKVDNIMFDEHGNAVVADFGIARALTGYTNQTGTGMVVGTPQYFAPEQARAKPLDGRADIYSLGVTLYRAATGRLPFVGDDWYEVARQHVEDTPAPPRTINPHISAEFETVMLRCLAKRPDDRPTTGEQLLDELEIVRSGGRLPTPVKARTLAVPSLVDTTVAPSSGLVTPVSVAPTESSTGGRAARREQRTVWLTGSLLLVLVVAAVPLLARRLPDATNGAAQDSLLPRSPGVVVSPPATALVGDSAAVDSATAARDSGKGPGPQRRDTAGRPVNTAVGRLTIVTPTEATVRLDGQPVSAGTWRADTMKAGDHEVIAAIPAIPGCESASVTKTIRIRAGGSREETITPKPCGRLEIDSRGSGQGRFTLTAAEAQYNRDGTIPLSAALVLPIGHYNLRVVRTDATVPCAAYADEVDIKVDETARTTFAFICGAK
ncbi:MAG: serine/threonine-protein kinase [Gemmatimonadaceae bacterium]